VTGNPLARYCESYGESSEFTSFYSISYVPDNRPAAGGRHPGSVRRLSRGALYLLSLAGFFGAWAVALPVHAELSGAGAPVPDSGALLSLPNEKVALNDTPLETVIVQATRLGGPGVSDTGANAYAVTALDISDSPGGEHTPLTDVLAQMPGVAIDQNQQIHIRNTEGPQFQYQINGVLIPLDINTNPPFLSMINPMFIERVNLLDGVLPSRYSYATGGVVDIRTKDGCEQSGGDVSVTAGQLDTVQPSAQYAGCVGALSAYVSGIYEQGDSAFSSATPGPNPIHDRTQQGQLFGFFSYPLNTETTLSVLLSAASSDNQLPNVDNLMPQYTLAGVTNIPSSAAINSYLNFSDELAVISLSSTPSEQLAYQLAYSEHSITQRFRPDQAGELIYQGVASTANHADRDHTLEGDLTYSLGAHSLGAGFYVGDYGVRVSDYSLVFPVDDTGAQSSDVPVTVNNRDHASNVVAGIYVSDLWKLTDRLSVNAGLRWDRLSGFSSGEQLDPTLNFIFQADTRTTWHAGFARYMQVPSFLGISPTVQAAFVGTTAAGPPGNPTPTTEDDGEWDAGLVHQLTSNWTVSADGFYELTHHYLDTGQFGVVPIFAPFNYDHGTIWGTELATRYKDKNFSAYASLTVGRNLQKGVETGQFNFDPDELAYIDSHSIVLDHQPLFGASAGATYQLRQYAFSLDGIYSSGLRGGFADEEKLPNVVQVNISAERTWELCGHHRLTNRLAILNIFDRVNLIRPAEGIGIFQSAYGPRITALDTLSVSF
jgi:TonB dependent receptor/TonB-dependent Receptor Plug Domain